MGLLLQNLTAGIRRLARHPESSLLAVGTLVLGLSASTAVFTYVNAYRQPFPGVEADGVFGLFQSWEGVAYGPVSYPDYRDLVEAGRDRFDVVGVGQPQFAASVRHETLTEVVFGEGVTGGFFPLLRVEMSLGRWLRPEDDAPGAPPAVVISHEYWVRRYGADPGVLGRTILLNNRPHMIVGVTGPAFKGSTSAFRPQVWMAFEPFKTVYWARSDTETNRESGAVTPFLKLRPGVSEAVAEEALASLASALDQTAPLAERTRRFSLEPATWIQPSVRQAELPTTRIMLLAAAALLLLACANVANVLLSAGARRSQELALRMAVGASRGRLFLQLLSENLLLSLLAGSLAFGVAGPAANRLSSYFARPSVWGTNVAREIHIDPNVLAFALMVALGTGFLTALVPALRASRQDPSPVLQGGGRWSSGMARGSGIWRLGTQDFLVTVQVALSVVLLFVSGLVLRTLWAAGDIDAGFDTQHTLASYVSTSSMETPEGERHFFYQELIRHFTALPWVEAAAVAQNAPLSFDPVLELRGGSLEQPVSTTIVRVFPGYFETLGMKLLRGRTFLPTDSTGAPDVVMVNESLARHLDPAGEAVGRTLRVPGDNGTPDREFEVVGVLEDARQSSLLVEPGPVAYFSYPQQYSPPGNAFILKVKDHPASTVDQVEQELRAVDPRIAIVNILPYSEVVGGFLYPQRMNAEMFTVIAVLGLVLTVTGVFGVLSLAVVGQRREIGIRMAIGATRRDIVRTVSRRLGVTVLVGFLVGFAGAILTGRLVSALLLGVGPADPLSLVAGAAVLLSAVVFAAALPLQRAVRVDPAGSLQAE